MAQFKITFGQKYRREPHPTLGFRPELVDGWLTMEAEDEAEARNKIAALIGGVYAFLYDETESLVQYHPHGDLGSLEDAVAEGRPTSWTIGVQFTVNANGTYELHIEDAADDLRGEGAPAAVIQALSDLTDYSRPEVSWVPR